MQMIAAKIVLMAVILSLINLALTIYVSQKKLYLAQALLPKSKIVADTQTNLTALGAVGKFYALSTTALALMIPWVFAQKKLVDLNEVEALPRNLRFWIIAPVATGWALLAIMLIAGSFLSI